MSIAYHLNACYTAKVLQSGVGYPEALKSFREALKTDGALLAEARRRRGAMKSLPPKRDFISTIMGPVLDEALEGLDAISGSA